MKVLMFGWEYPPEISGGLGVATHGLLDGLAKQNADVSFVLPTFKKKPLKGKWKIIDASKVQVKTGEIIEQEYREKITYIEIGSMLMPYLSNTDYKQLQQQKIPGITKKIKVLKESYQFEGGYGQNLTEEVTRLAIVATELASVEKYDVIHGHDWMTYPASLAAGAKANKPVILHVHSTEFERSFPNIDQDIFELEKKSFENADHVITVSNLTRKILVEHYLIEPKKITIVHNSFSQEFSKTPPRKASSSKLKTVTFLGRLARQKAPSLFVDVAKTLGDRNSNYRFVMAGEGYLLSGIKDKVNQLNLQNKFSFPGFLSTEKVKKLFAKTDIFLMPASAEPFGMVTLEAAFSGIPVVLSKQTGALEVLTSALSFECWETYKMADAIDGLINNPEETKVYAKKVQKEAANTSWEKAASKVIGVYGKLK